MDEKKTLRTRMKEVRAGLKSPEKDKPIEENVLSAFGEEESFFVYLSFGSEVATEGIVRALLARGKKVCVPLVEGGVMRSVPYREPLEAGAYGILQPEGGEETACLVKNQGAAYASHSSGEDGAGDMHFCVRSHKTPKGKDDFRGNGRKEIFGHDQKGKA